MVHLRSTTSIFKLVLGLSVGVVIFIIIQMSYLPGAEKVSSVHLYSELTVYCWITTKRKHAIWSHLKVNGVIHFSILLLRLLTMTIACSALLGHLLSRTPGRCWGYHSNRPTDLTWPDLTWPGLLPCRARGRYWSSGWSSTWPDLTWPDLLPCRARGRYLSSDWSTWRATCPAADAWQGNFTTPSNGWWRRRPHGLLWEESRHPRPRRRPPPPLRVGSRRTRARSAGSAVSRRAKLTSRWVSVSVSWFTPGAGWSRGHVGDVAVGVVAQSQLGSGCGWAALRGAFVDVVATLCGGSGLP